MKYDRRRSQNVTVTVSYFNSLYSVITLSGKDRLSIPAAFPICRESLSTRSLQFIAVNTTLLTTLFKEGAGEF